MSWFHRVGVFVCMFGMVLKIILAYFSFKNILWIYLFIFVNIRLIILIGLLWDKQTTQFNGYGRWTSILTGTCKKCDLATQKSQLYVNQTFFQHKFNKKKSYCREVKHRLSIKALRKTKHELTWNITPHQMMHLCVSKKNAHSHSLSNSTILIARKNKIKRYMKKISNT